MRKDYGVAIISFLCAEDASRSEGWGGALWLLGAAGRQNTRVSAESVSDMTCRRCNTHHVL